MPTWRKLHVKTTESLDINDMPDDFTRLLWVLLPLGLDREGRGLDHAGWVRSKIMPLREDVTGEMVKAALAWYEDRGMIERYERNGRKYFNVPTWRSYQGETKREKPSDFPGPLQELVTSNSGVSQELVVQRSRLDIDIDVDIDVEVDTKEEAPTAAPPVEPSKPSTPRQPKLTDGQRECLALFGAKRFKTVAQRAAILKLENQYGSEKLLEAGRWAAEKGLRVGDSVGAVRGALPKWGKPKRKPGRQARTGRDYITGEFEGSIQR